MMRFSMFDVSVKSFEEFLGKREVGLSPRVSFVEDKNVDYDLLRGFLKVSKERNHWSNFGPVSRYLESSIEEILGLQSGRKAVMCSSGTSALLALVGLENIKAGKKLKWVVSAYGFIASHIGPLSDAIVVDCDERGVLSLESLKALKEPWDAVLLTNPFALCSSFENLQEYCEAKGKVCLIDNAAALINEARSVGPETNELISFHHTKPWGFGEGGCAIVEAADEANFRSLLNFGNPVQKSERSQVSNWKMSDVAAAFILQRLACMDDWAQGYATQLRRVQLIASEFGFLPLNPVPENALLGNVPLLAPFELTWTDLENSFVVLNKYYIPLQEHHQNAGAIFRKIVNFPCHTGVERLSDSEIAQVFLGLAKSAGR